MMNFPNKSSQAQSIGKAISAAVKDATNVAVKQIEECKEDVGELEALTDKIGEQYHFFSKDVLRVSGLSSATEKKWEVMDPYVKEIDEISRTIDKMEKTVEELNEFVTELEVRWEQLQTT
mmetsp:Transcript_16181/g.21431  ORF Transcript_16181/g.21431 Transcript_16181/m.21431 type:complete len:120 (-) Transcript_16181:390-749(-)|eukprot:CAMPEP_0117757694 /NCGR_PEP_ID=MMETSP0947-20121206/14898_1 /TAXON_ID=44440 /ORGANISM="Chattonella subsalsa, Strain CCMP2191" /LENGTH=119 /DNA_ID=CAMNT_0005577665 /DNA_START=31 /DNA_END=390 /DNA_ORIENTATION=-